MSLIKHLQKPKVRTSAQSALVKSTHVPNSGLTFVENSQGCSAAVAELSELLDVAIEQFDCEREPSDQLQLQLRRLYNEAENYSNGTLGAGTDMVVPWNCSRHDAEIISAAFACAVAIYEGDANPSVAEFQFGKEGFFNPSIAGTTKATSVYLVERDNKEITGSGDLLPMIVVAIRGTASRVDRMVNLNGEGKPLKLPIIPSVDADGTPILAHAGFLNAANDFEPFASRKLKGIIACRYVSHVMFTGHSAGGATASLLFANYLSRAATDYPSIKFSSISFGAPPVTRPDLDSYLLDPSSPFANNRALVLSMVDEYDLVSRTDGAYIPSLVDLYRSIYNLPPIQDDSLSQFSQESEISLPRFSFEKREIVEKIQRVKWPLPKPVYWHIGKIVVFRTEIVVFRTEIVVFRTEIVEGEDDDDEELMMSAFEVGREEFGHVLWCNCAVHKRVRYRERVDLLEKGRFNGRTGW